MNPTIVTAPTNEPLFLQEVMEQAIIGLDERHNDEWFARAIRTAREVAEGYLNAALTDAEYDYTVDRLSGCCGIRLPLARVSVQSIVYIDTDGVEQTLPTTDYVLDSAPPFPVIRQAFGVTWPTARCQSNAVTIRFKGIHSEADSPPHASVPQKIKQAMVVMIAAWFEDRTGLGDMPPGALVMLNQERVGWGV